MKLSRSFYLKDTLFIAQFLLGCYLFRSSDAGITVGRIVETEAYIGPLDQASHARNWLRSTRTEVQYKEGGFVYIYQVYGVHYCLNVVTALSNHPEVVLIRALEPVEGLHLLARRRKLDPPYNLRALTSGPGRLCQAMGLDMSAYGEDLCGDKIWITTPTNRVSPDRILATKRINIDYAGPSKDLYWRFIIIDNPFVSIGF